MANKPDNSLAYGTSGLPENGVSDYPALRLKYEESLAENRWRACIVDAVRSRRDVDGLLRLISDIALEEFGFERSGIFYFDKSSESMSGAWSTEERHGIKDAPPTVFSASNSDRRLWRDMLANEVGYLLQPFEGNDCRVGFPPEMSGTCVHAMILLSAGGEFAGCLYVDNPRSCRPIEPSQLVKVVLFAEHAGLALFNTKLIAEREALIRQQKRIMGIIVATAENKELDATFQLIRDAVTELGFVDRAGLWLVDGDMVRGTWGTDEFGRRTDEHGDSFLLSSQSEAFNACLNGDEPFLIDVLDRQVLATGEIRTNIPHALIPLRTGTDLVGVLTIDTLLTMRSISAEHLELILPLAELAAVVIVRRRLLVEARKEIERRRDIEKLLIDQARELIVARDEALAGARVKSEFLANMSHEIRTPMNGVVGLTSLLMDTALTDQQQSLAVGIQRSAEALLVVINDVLDLSRLEAGKLKIASEPFSLRHCFSDVTKMVQSQNQNPSVTLKWSVPGDFPDWLVGDEDRVRQMVTNLLANAVKFTRKGEVLLLAECQSQTASRAKVRIEVRDTGIGIADDRQSAVFDSFTQADGSSTRRHDGSGLGLTITKQIVELMGGTISLKSRLGEGTTVWLDIAFDKPQAQSGVETKIEEVPEGALNLRILLAEDNPVNAIVTTGRLESWGCTVVEVENGRHAVEAFASGNFDLVLMDVSMPEMDGLEATQALRLLEEPTGKHIPILAVTAHAMDGDRERCLDAGMDDYISKPIHFGQLRLLLLRWKRKIRGANLS